MGVLQSILLSAACASLFPILASASDPIQGRLRLSGLTNDFASSQAKNSSIHISEVFPLYARDNSLIFNRRQEFECPPATPLPCPDGIHCTTAAYDVCCSDGLHSCETGGSCCDGGTHCAPDGGLCCGITACEEGWKCCSGSEGCCEDAQTCCASGCADAGKSCCGTQYQCDTTDEQCCSGNGCAPKDATCCGPDHYCEAGGTCCIGPQQNDDGSDDYFCSPGTTCLDTLYLDLNDYPGEDEIFENMCRGNMQWPGFDADRPNEILLTYNGKNQNAAAAANRRAAGCAGSPCARIFGETLPNGDRIRWSCEEWPPAASAEGGALASIVCVPQSINSAIGSRWRWAVDGMSKGDQVRVKIKGIDCSKYTNDKRRWVEEDKKMLLGRAATGAVLKNDSEVIFVNSSIYGNKTDGSVAMIIPFDVPYDFEGTFNVNYTISSGRLKSGSLIDDWGNDFGSIPISNSGQTASGNIEVGPDGVGDVMMFAWADTTAVSMSYSTSFSTSSTTTKSTAKSTSTATSTHSTLTAASTATTTIPTTTSAGTGAKATHVPGFILWVGVPIAAAMVA